MGVNTIRSSQECWKHASSAAAALPSAMEKPNFDPRARGDVSWVCASTPVVARTMTAAGYLQLFGKVAEAGDLVE